MSVLDLILLFVLGSAFVAGVYVGSTYGSMKTLIVKARDWAKSKL